VRKFALPTFKTSLFFPLDRQHNSTIPRSTCKFTQHACPCTNINRHTQTHTHTHTHTHAHTHAQTHTTHTHMRAHTHIHTHTHMSATTPVITHQWHLWVIGLQLAVLVSRKWGRGSPCPARVLDAACRKEALQHQAPDKQRGLPQMPLWFVAWPGWWSGCTFWLMAYI